MPDDLTQTAVEHTQDAERPPSLPVGSPPPATGAASLPARMGVMYAKWSGSRSKKWAIPGCAVLVLVLVVSLCTNKSKPEKHEAEAEAGAVSSINLEQEKREIERDFRRLFPDASYSDLDKEYSDGGMVGFVREMISGGSAMASIYPEHRSEVRQWENLKARMDTYKQIKSKMQH